MEIFMDKGDRKLYLITLVLMFLACVFSGLALWLIFGGIR
jgi:hypothetical protein